MTFFINIATYFLIGVMVIQNHLFVAAALVLLFTFRVGALWLVPLAIVVDGYFGAFATTPVFSLVTIVWYAVSEFIRPQLLLQHTPYEQA